ncbi:MULTISPECIES: DeoR/GlpR family DNA-binding transcription regulator [Chryseobacterium]|uniref:DeoR/GlpR family transcriptional regulator of sugar metabolism n=1 Tax=Chryseobacterium camelliae TaxID=1265445 RepID=A0ABU0TE48_9FLAO|nr:MULTISPECIES: DeoR/GlpR family DNA-binding transcription regulator [Chryseobacterium]MDT3406857.1 DeoR/GlpR family transcriptional regulator of sugar metabolism [Pseudacidovorax intermedius]MDQ1095348.1 DeoR/GlpR family transcriptional regulator of sugar metabolism [Chryseobacterium camelliae]MDQ1099286.1 DeoR/GlpR family transcriptional regulator of sugar metabolism [Chryseobacterium sp. SORGH_AS_1048]MDR6086635.1 DeoR/GlpR family transcriptional regulator of sugar metabolism [Chryseobacter
MLKEERFEIILKELKDRKKVKFEDLAGQLHVSEDTIRRDIDILHRNGLLSKARGGAILREKDPLTFHDRKSFLTKEKDIIALKTQQFIKNGMTVFMDGGTTICAVVNCMPLDVRLRIITNNYSIIPIVEKFKNVELILLGGNYERDLAVTSGVTTCHEASKYLADVFIMGTCAADPHYGITSVSITDGETKKAMVQSSKKTIALASRNKLSHSEAFKVCEISQVSTLITDLNSDDPQLDSFRKSNLHIV